MTKFVIRYDKIINKYLTLWNAVLWDFDFNEINI